MVHNMYKVQRNKFLGIKNELRLILECLVCDYRIDVVGKILLEELELDVSFAILNDI